MQFTEVESTDYICVDLDGDWCVKIVDNYGNVNFIGIKDNLKNKESIHEVVDIFNNLILPEDKLDFKGNITTWEIADHNNLYLLNTLPQNYWNTDNDPKCEMSESESYIEQEINSDIENYFDSTIQNF